MTKKRSDALTSLIHELVDAEREVALLRAVEEEVRQESVAAAQSLAAARQRREAGEERQKATRMALGIIQGRDEIGDDVVAALVDRQAGR